MSENLISRKDTLDGMKKLSAMYDAETVQRCIEIVSNAPTVDAEPVRHGKWITSYIERNSSGVRPCYLFCSECQHYQRHTSKYCPSCGAKMDGGEE